MSYSFGGKAANKAEARIKITAELDKVVNGQPVHALDRAAADNAIGAALDLLVEDGEHDIGYSIGGSITAVEGGPIQGVSLSVNVYTTQRLVE